ncbi:hypothetical protein F5I97DRAFT_1929344 [Phlebopus sp. FC_14]|nr:hypothetical protein F5I97DRAFT_1929344 [Phlebopus sp. FC_14]
MSWLPTSPHMPRKGGDAENENPASPPLSPKRAFAQDDEDPSPQADSKRRHVHSEGDSSRRAPLDPLSASDVENRRNRDPRWISSSTHHSLTTSQSLADLRSFKLEHPGPSWVQQCSATGRATCESVCSWPPPSSGGGSPKHSTLNERHVLQSDILYSSDARRVLRAIIGTSTSSCSSSSISPETSTMIKHTRAHGCKAETFLQPIKCRTTPLPQVRPPPRDPWRADLTSSPSQSHPGLEPPRTVNGSIDDSGAVLYATPQLRELQPSPRVPPYRPELRRCASGPRLGHGSASLSLASGSQPLLASEQAKPIAPIGAERSRVVPMIPVKPQKPTTAQVQATATGDASPYLWYPPLNSPKLQATWKKIVSSKHKENVSDIPRDPLLSKEAFDRLLRHAMNNKHAVKIISPLSPLRTPRPPLTLTTNAAYRLRMPSVSNKPSLRYSKGPETRLRTLCDGCQPHDLDTTCTHCQECKRDTVGKRLLAFRYRQQSQVEQTFGDKPTNSARSYCEMIEADEEEKSLWDEVAAATSSELFPCGSDVVEASSGPHLQDLDDFDTNREDFLEIPDEDLLMNRSLREVEAY